MTETENKTQEINPIQPQEWFQMEFLSSSADIVIGWGCAGAGKTFALLLEPLRHIETIPGFGWVIFRRTTPQIRNEWWLRDKSGKLYPLVWLTPKETTLERTYSMNPLTENKIKFAHLEHENNKHDRQWSEIPFIGFDELTHFTKSQFFYLLSRNRSTCGVRPYVRAVCNPDPDSRVKDFISWRIDPETGFIIPDRCWVLRYFTQDWDSFVRWASAKEVIDKCPHIFSNKKLQEYDIEDLIKSVTFIEWDIYQNQALLSKDPGYLANLLAMDPIVKKQLLEKNWNVHQDWLELFSYASVNDVFSNFVEESNDKHITVDVARFGRDLAVIKVWFGRTVKRIRIFSKSAITDLHSAIEKLRQEDKIQASHVIVDQDWMWWGLVDMGKYTGFSWWRPAMEDPKTKIKENYDMLKTQCFYRIADRVNDGKIRVNTDDITVDWVRTKTIKIWSQVYSFEELFKKQLRVIKRKNPDSDWKKKINSKEEQKNSLGGMSPDIADTFMMRELAELADLPGEFKIRKL